MTSPHNLLALLDELEKKAEQYEAPDYLMMLPVHADMLKAFPFLSQKLRESVEALEEEASHCVPYMNDECQERHARLSKVIDSINSLPTQ